MLKNFISNSILLKSSSFYTLSGIINSAIPFLFLPILTRILTPSEYGIIAMFQISVSIVLPFVGLNLEAAIARKYYDGENSKFSSFAGTSTLLGTASAIIIGFIFWFYSDSLSNLTQIPKEYIIFIVTLAYLRFLMLVLLAIFQVKLKALSYGLFQIIHSALSLSATLYLLFVVALTWEARIIGQLIAGFIIAIFSLIIMLKNDYIKWTVTKKDINYAVSFGVPLIPHAIGSVGLIVIDRFFLTELIGVDATGIFTIAYQLGAIISIITISFNNAFVPWLFNNLNKNDVFLKRKIVKITYVYFIAIIFISISLIILFPLLLNIFIGQKFHSIDQYSYLIILGFAFQGMFFMVTNYLYYVKKTYLQSLISFGIIAIKIPLTYYAITNYGLAGAAWSFLLTYFLFFLITWFVSSRVYKMPWNLLATNKN
jgi:O-antigen/teichoic acid export membrane protein